MSGWRLRIRHRTGFSYGGPVAASYNEARMTPRDEPGQVVLDSRVEVAPSAHTYRYEDYWETVVTAFDVQTAHESLVVTATSIVETSAVRPAPEPVPWAGLDAPEVADRWHELRLPTPRTELDEELTALAAGIRAAEPDPHAAALATCALVHEQVAYRPGATEVQTDARHAWRQRAGVCQDLSHLAVGLLRAQGIPARYVSGYLHPAPDAALDEPVVGQSHAWVQWWAGEWVGYDPTNGEPIGPRHVLVGSGREYGDVPPLKGVYSGLEHTELGVEVELTRLR